MIAEQGSSSTHYEREYERQTVLVEARIQDGQEWCDCRIVNISVGGAKLRTSRQLNTGTSVLLHIDHFGQFSGTIVWQHTDEIGVKFTHNTAEIAEVVMGLAMYG